ncbi:MAG TPA: ATP-binding cassette domain-containing protein [Streptosporangiaceae bacterium]|jgi:phospholipid/cholesterol/gamma-HCH transport system ATP-binding protein|nr:ATP-binding cassette domain-containing protein [Streptosporangiaceae bacterium]
MGTEVVVEGLTKSFGRHQVWRDISLSLPAGEVSVMLGPSGTGKTVFLKSLVGLIKPDRGRIVVDGIDMVSSSERDLYQARKLFGVMFQDGALFGSLNLYDNIAFPLREHTKMSERQVRSVVSEKMDMVGLGGEGHKFPGEISGGMRKRAGLARALVLDPQIILCDEPDSGLDPVRTAYLSQLLIDLNAEIDATILIVTHDIQIARTVPDNIGMLFRGDLVMFGPREVLLTSDNPVITQFVNGRRIGPIGMSEEKDEATVALERAQHGAPDTALPALVPQLDPTPGLPERLAVGRRRARVSGMLHTLPPRAQQAILATLGPGDRPGAPPQGGPAGAPAQGAPTRTLPSAEPANAVPAEPPSRRGGWPPHWPGGPR